LRRLPRFTVTAPRRTSGPRLGQAQQARQEQRLLPQQLQSVELLALPAAELGAWLVEAYAGNEALELEWRSAGPPPPSEQRGPRRSGDDEAALRHSAWLESASADRRPLGLVDRLEAQLALLDLDPERRRWCLFLVAELDSDGLLTATDEHLLERAAAIGLSTEDGALGRALSIVQGLDPKGVAGRDQAEALLLQLDPEDPNYPLLAELIENHLELVARNKLPQVARELDVDVAEVELLVRRLGELDLRPAGADIEVHAPVLNPDVVVDWDGQGFELRLTRGDLPDVRIDPEVERLARSTETDADLRRYLRGKVDEARGIVDALAQRRTTLARVSAAIFHRQTGYLLHGPARIAPLTMTQLAAELELHPSTVSRCVAGKSVQTPWGIVTLRSFFEAAASKASVSGRSSAAACLAELVAAEDKRRPLSDEELVAALARRGFDVARRTVAKHRGELGIPSSYQRRSYAA
jgi:RNA polymerase sigma-54 factor